MPESSATQAAIEAKKRALRAEVSLRIPAAGSAAHAEASERAQRRLAQHPLVRAARCVALYRALKSEVATGAVAGELKAAGKDVCFPAVGDKDPVLHFRRAHGRLVVGQLGVEEPEDLPDARVRLADIDLFVVPARAVDKRGHRLGRGKGHYDATLSAAGGRARRVCLVFDAQVVDRVPFEAHDQRMDAVCSDARWIDCPERA